MFGIYLFVVLFTREIVSAKSFLATVSVSTAAILALLFLVGVKPVGGELQRLDPLCSGPEEWTVDVGLLRLRDPAEGDDTGEETCSER